MYKQFGLCGREDPRILHGKATVEALHDVEKTARAYMK